MKEYIDKAVVKAWIKEKKIPFKKDIDDGVYPTYFCALMDFEDFLDTLEIKEVEEKPSDDLEEEIDKELHENWYGEYINLDKFRESANHFYELGLKAQKGE